MSDRSSPYTMSVGEVWTASRWNSSVRDNTMLVYEIAAEYENKNTVTEIDMTQGQITVPANAMGANRMMDIWLSGGMVNATGTSKNRPYYRLKFGSSLIFDTGTVGSIPNSGSATYGTWWFFIRMKQRNATNFQHSTLWGHFLDGTKLNFNAGAGAMGQGDPYYGNADSTVDFTTAQTMQFTTNNGTASNSLAQKLYCATVTIY